jgi:hypothetical protein
MMMVSNVAVIVECCLVDLNADSKVIATSPLSVTSVDVVLLSFGEIIPFRLWGAFTEEVSSISPTASVNDLGSGQWVTRV